MRFGLYAAGSVGASLVGRLPALGTQLGPVAASSYRLASRIVNSLRAGRPARDCTELDRCELILIAVPETSIAAAARRLETSGLKWNAKVVLACNGGPAGEALDGLRARGAAIGSLWHIGSGDRYAAEGDRQAVREARRLVQQLGGRIIELSRPDLGLYAAGISFATTLFTPIIAASVDSLRQAGCSRSVALEITGDLFQRTLRSWLHTGRKNRPGPLRSGDLAEIRRQFKALAARDPRAARFYRHAAALAVEYFNRRGDRLKDLPG